MDSLITAAGRALAGGDPLGALRRVALREDPPALALRGIAMAQLGDFPRSRALLRRAARAFGTRERLARARCVVAEAEVALAARDLGWPEGRLDAARRTLETLGDDVNAAHARLLAIRHDVLCGHVAAAEREASSLRPDALPASLRAVHALLLSGIAVRRLQSRGADAALTRATDAAGASRIPALIAEVAAARRALEAPVARLQSHAGLRELRLADVESLMRSDALIVDECRGAVRRRDLGADLSRRPVLFALARGLAERWPDTAPRDALIAAAFRIRRVDETHRARLRVEVGRLRTALRGLADIRATPHGFVLQLRDADGIAILRRPVDGEQAALLAVLADGATWSTSALARVLGTSQRSVQRSLETLARNGRAFALGRGRAHRWIAAPLPGFATALLLPAPLPAD